jgi:hypothetical protein
MAADGDGAEDAGGDAGAEDGAGTRDDVDTGDGADGAGELEDAELAFAADLVVGAGPITCSKLAGRFEGAKASVSKRVRDGASACQGTCEKRAAVRNADRKVSVWHERVHTNCVYSPVRNADRKVYVQ